MSHLTMLLNADVESLGPEALVSGFKALFVLAGPGAGAAAAKYENEIRRRLSDERREGQESHEQLV